MGDAADDYYDSIMRQQDEWEPRDEDEDLDDEDDWPLDCHMHADGQCGAAGSEHCEFECPVMREWRREPWDENGPIKDDDPQGQQNEGAES